MFAGVHGHVQRHAHRLACRDVYKNKNVPHGVEDLTQTYTTNYMRIDMCLYVPYIAIAYVVMAM